MAEGKNSFLLYRDIKFTLDKLTDEQAGKLFKHILNYVNDINPICDDFVIELAFEPIKQGLKRDLKKWEKICERNKNNGSKGGRPKNPDEPKKPSGIIGNPKNPDEPKKADTDTDTDTDNDTDTGIEKKRKEKVFFDNENLQKTFLQFLDMRKRIKKPATEKAIELLICKLEKLSGDQAQKIAILEQSILNNWQDIYQLKSQHNGQPKRKDSDFD